MTRRVPWLLVLLLLAAPGTARSEQPSEALLRQAFERYAAADFQGSVQVLLQARQSASEPDVLARIELHLGVNHEVLGHATEAAQAFRAALVHDPMLVIAPQRFRSSAVSLFNRVRASLRGELRVRAPADVTLELDGTKAGSGAVTRQLPIGLHEVKLRTADGAVLLARSVLIAPDTTVTVTAPVPKHPRARVTPPLPKRPKARVAPRAVRPGAVGHSTSGRRRIWTWVAAGGALTALAVAIGLGTGAAADHEEWKDAWEAGEDRTRWDNLYASGQRKELAANVLFGGAGALAVAAAILYFWEGTPARGDGQSAGAGRTTRVGLTGLEVVF